MIIDEVHAVASVNRHWNTHFLHVWRQPQRPGRRVRQDGQGQAITAFVVPGLRSASRVTTGIRQTNAIFAIQLGQELVKPPLRRIALAVNSFDAAQHRLIQIEKCRQCFGDALRLVLKGRILPDLCLRQWRYRGYGTPCKREHARAESQYPEKHGSSSQSYLCSPCEVCSQTLPLIEIGRASCRERV